MSIKKAFEEVFGSGNVDVEVYGNVLIEIGRASCRERV